MASCPTCYAAGGNWRHCWGCGTYWCLNCRLRENPARARLCPSCEYARTVEYRGPERVVPAA